ncbi:MAG: outer membrane beta-barrel protein [Flavobacteriales bacterium]|nr:outer membrane beta-barrel protein [Flavobacteriales bacterium]
MKKQLFIIAAALLSTIGSFAQSGRPSLGLELALPMGDFGDAYGIGYGLSAGYEHPVGDKLGITANVGYILLSPDEAIKDFIESSSMIPIQVGAKYYFSEQQSGPYGHVQLGVHTSSVKTAEFELLGVTIPSETESSTNLSFAFGAGFVLNEKIDLGIRYNIITPDSDIEEAKSSAYLGLRVAYMFGGN